MTNTKPYVPRRGGRYLRDKDTGKIERVEGTESEAPAPAEPPEKKPAKAKAAKKD